MAHDALRETVHTSLPATVVTYYPATQTADIEIMVNRPMIDLVTGDVEYEVFPQIPQVPIAFARGGGFVVAFPLNPGDGLSFVCTMYDFEAWRTTGQIASPIDPTPHGLQGWAFPTTILDSKPILSAAAAGAGLVVGFDGTGAQIHIPTGGASVSIVQASTVALGDATTASASLGGAATTSVKLGPGTTPLALSNLTDGAVAAILAAFNSHVHAVASFGPSAPPTVPMTPPPTTAATVVKGA